MNVYLPAYINITISTLSKYMNKFSNKSCNKSMAVLNMYLCMYVNNLDVNLCMAVVFLDCLNNGCNNSTTV